MASMRDIKRRRNSVQSTQQITKAMKLVSTVKLQKARLRAEATDPYFKHTYATVSSILRRSGNIIDSPYTVPREGGKKAVILISGNRGLAGGYNSNVIKLLTESGWSKDEVVVYAAGGKGYEYLHSKGYEMRGDYSGSVEAPTYADAMQLCNDVLSAFKDGDVSEIYLAYTHFKNTVSYMPTMMQILPVSLDDGDEVPSDNVFMNYEPNEEEALEMIIPKYLSSLIYGALIEAVASENGARMTAMDSATNNAEEIINDLTLKYNRARQGAITREITEIVAGADALA